MSLAYAFEKFSIAIDTLAEGTGPLQERLWDAWISALSPIETCRVIFETAGR